MAKKWKVIYYTTEDGKTAVEEFINSRSLSNKLKIASLIDYLQEMGVNLPRPYADYLGDGIYELRIKLSGEQSRTLYFFCYEKYIVLTHSFIKKTQKVPEQELKRAKLYRTDFINRFSKDKLKELLK